MCGTPLPSVRPAGHPAGVTVVELLVVVAILALLAGLLLPAVSRARDQARVTISQGHLRQLGQAAAGYAGEWNGRQFTVVADNLAQYGTDIVGALAAFNAQQAGSQRGNHAPVLTGWGGGGAWGWWFDDPRDNGPLLSALSFDGPFAYFGWFRLPNVKGFNQYLNGRWYDPIFWAPKDRVVVSRLGECFDQPHEFVDCFEHDHDGAHDSDHLHGFAIWSSYCFSPAALFSPDVFRSPEQGGFQVPFQDVRGSALRVPALGQARYADLKTHFIEHHWLQNAHQQCNPNFVPGSYDGCEPYYFNHGYESVPMACFYDGHVEGLGVPEAQGADSRHEAQTGHGLWSRDTPFGTDGYLIGDSWDFLTATSFHVLTTGGILGRDTLAD